MKRTWPIIGVADVATSSAWYMKLLNGENNHPGATVFDQIMDADGTVLVCVHHWGDHGHPSLSNPEGGTVGKGLLLWFLVDDFDAAWDRAQAMEARVEETPHTDNGTLMRAFVVWDPAVGPPQPALSPEGREEAA